MTKNKHHKPASSDPDQAPAAGNGADPAAAPASPPPPAAAAPDPRDQELATLKDQLLRLHADFDNHRKRLLRERQDMAQQALADFMLELLPVLDNLGRGQEVATQHQADQAIRDGFEMIIAQLTGVLTRFGLSPVEEPVGKPFDPNTSEAVSYIPSADRAEGMVLVQTRRGYRLNSRLLRPAQVVVSSGPAAAGPAPEQAAEE